MQIETFKVFCDLVDTGSFSKAASLNSVTQSAVSQQIHALEQRFHVVLIERGTRNFALTAEGAAFLEAGEEILHIYNSLGDRLHELQNIIAGDLTLATIFSVGLHELPPYLKEFRGLHPKVEIHVEYRRSAEVYQCVQAGEVDFGMVSFPAKRKGLLVEPFLKDRMVLICPPSHRFAGRAKVRLDEMHGEKFITFEPDLPTRKVLDRYFKEAGVLIRRAQEFDNIETVKRAVEIESGISIVPENTITAEVRSGLLAAVPVDHPGMWRPLGILMKRGRARSPAQKEFIALLQRDLAKTAPADSPPRAGAK